MKRLLVRAVFIGALFPVSPLSNAAEDAVVVTATRFPERLLDAPVGLTLINRERIESSTARSLPDLLSQEAGVVIRDNTGGPDSQIDLRGFGVTGDQNTVVLLNGQRLNEIELVTIRWSSIPIDSVERVEILRGSGAVLYGPGATGGTINIITRVPRAGARSASIGFGAGSHGTLEKRVNLSLAGERVGMALHASDYRSDNFRQNNEIAQRNLNGEMRWSGARRHLAIKAGVEEQSLRLPGILSAAQIAADPRAASTPRDFANRDGLRASIGGGMEIGAGELAAEFAWRDSTRTSSQKDYSGGGFDTYLDTHSRNWTFSPRFKLPWQAFGMRNSFVIGIDIDNWGYTSQRSRTLETLAAPAANIIATQQSEAMYAQNHLELNDRTKLTLGARQQRVTTVANDRVNPAAYASGRKTSTPAAWEVGLRHQWSESTAAYGKTGRSFRVATIDESYSQFNGPLFDAVVTLLEPQTSRDHEAGLEWSSGGRKLRVSAYMNDLQNEIYLFLPAGAGFGPPFTNINLPPTRREGIEFDGSASIFPGLSVFANASAVNARFRDGVIGGVNVKGKSIPLVPRETANLGIAWAPSERTRLSVAWHRVGTQYYDNDQANTFPSRMPAYTTLDVKLVQVVGKARFALSASNLLDTRYYTYAVRNGAGTSFNGYPQAGRSLRATVELRFD